MSSDENDLEGTELQTTNKWICGHIDGSHMPSLAVLPY